VAVYRFDTFVAAPREVVFDLWTNLDRMAEWVGGVTKVTDLTGPTDRAGTRYTVWFGGMRSPVQILEAERPRLVRTKFGSRLLRGQTSVSFEPEGDGTRLSQEFRTEGLIPALAARIFATGSYRGSFRGELEAFARLAEREAQGTAGG
jgi:uncharacterized protein YndB with AHSA1/START domain